jgi:hypothetical protein
LALGYLKIMNNKFASPIGLRISAWIVSGLSGGTAYGMVSFYTAQGAAISGFIGAIAGLITALFFSIPAPALIQGLFTGVFSGLSVGLLDLLIFSPHQPVMKTIMGAVIPLTIGLTIFRFINIGVAGRLFARSWKDNTAQQGAAANP